MLQESKKHRRSEREIDLLQGFPKKLGWVQGRGETRERERTPPKMPVPVSRLTGCKRIQNRVVRKDSQYSLDNTVPPQRTAVATLKEAIALRQPRKQAGRQAASVTAVKYVDGHRNGKEGAE